jgi:hypothetical protein
MRVTDILFEFAPTTPEEDEKRLANFPGQSSEEEPADTTAQPAPVEPVQQPAPAQQAPATPVEPVQQPAPAQQAPAQPADTRKIPIIASIVISKFKKLIADANLLPDWDPAKDLVLKLVNTLEPDIELTESASKIVSPSREAVILAAIKELEVMGLMKLDATLDVASLAISVSKKRKVSTEFNKLESVWQEQAEEITNSIFDKLEMLANKVQGYTAIEDSVYKALNKTEKKIHDNARNFAAVFKQAFFGMIMRMLSQNKTLDRASIVKFLDACYNGQVIDMESLISKDSGNVRDHVTGYQDMLDLFSSYGVFSWSPGKASGAIGPGEMALSMMGSPAQKASHGGDLIVAGTNLEIKAGATSGGRLNSKKILKGPAAWPTWTEKITKIIRTAPAKKLKSGSIMGTTTDKSGEVHEMTKENYTPNTYNKNPKGHFKQGCVYNWSYKMLEKLNEEVLVYSTYEKTYDLFFSTISKLVTNLDEIAEPMMVTMNKKQVPKLSADGKIAFPGINAEEIISNAVMEDGTIIVPAMMEAYTKIAYASYNRADGVEAIMFLNTETLDYTIAKNGEDLAGKMLGKGDATVRISGGFNFNDDQQSATPAYLAVARSPKIERR